MDNRLIVGVELVDAKNLPEFFTHKKLKNSYCIKDTSLYPNKITMLNNQFVQAYSLQLEKIIFNDKEELNMKELMPILILVERIIENRLPVYLEHNMSRKYSGETLKVLDKFLRDNLDTLKIMYKNLTNKMID